MENTPKLIVYISMSLDGFLATKDDDISWLDIANKEGEDYGYTAFSQSIDKYIIGRKTYDVVMKLTDGDFPQAKMYDCYVITRQNKEDENDIKYYSGDIEVLVNSLKEKGGKNIYCDGGGEIVKLLMEKDLIDEYIIAVIPIVLGDGKRLFIGGTPQINLTLKGSKQYETGLVQLHYIRDKK